MKWLSLVLALLAVCSAERAAAAPRAMSIGGTEFRLSVPAGYVDLCSQDAEAARVFALEVPPVNEFLSCYTTPGDFEAWTSRVGGVFESVLVVAVMKSSIGRTVSPAEFAAFRRRINAEVSTLRDRFAPLFENPIGKPENGVSARESLTIRVEPGQTVPLGVFDEARNCIASVWLASNQYSVDNETTVSRKVSISTAILVQGKVLVLSTTGEYRQASDIRKYQDIARGWRARLIADNT